MVEVVDICTVFQIDVRHIDRLSRSTTFLSAHRKYYLCYYESVRMELFKMQVQSLRLYRAPLIVSVCCRHEEAPICISL
jgi:predicted transcriptional regulator